MMTTTKTPTVYVTQIPVKKDLKTGAFYESVDIKNAAEHGEIKVMFPGRVSFFATADLVKQLREYLQHYDYDSGDSIIFLGDPAIIAVASALLGRLFGHFIILKWDRNIGRYLPTHVHV